jgi:hypothetical protein
MKQYNDQETRGLFKSEIDLVEYYRQRPDATEELESVLRVLPTTRSVWGAESKLNRSDMLDALFRAVESDWSNPIKDKFKQKLEKIREKLKQHPALHPGSTPVAVKLKKRRAPKAMTGSAGRRRKRSATSLRSKNRARFRRFK